VAGFPPVRAQSARAPGETGTRDFERRIGAEQVDPPASNRARQSQPRRAGGAAPAFVAIRAKFQSGKAPTRSAVRLDLCRQPILVGLDRAAIGRPDQFRHFLAPCSWPAVAIVERSAAASRHGLAASLRSEYRSDGQAGLARRRFVGPPLAFFFAAPRNERTGDVRRRVRLSFFHRPDRLAAYNCGENRAFVGELGGLLPLGHGLPDRSKPLIRLAMRRFAWRYGACAGLPGVIRGNLPQLCQKEITDSPKSRQ
jgi:hypothetical protein